MFRCHCWDLIVTQFRHLTWDKWKLKCCFTGLRSVVLCSQQFFTGHDRCLLLLPAVERLLFLPACSHPLTEVITEEASDRSALVWGKNSSLALNFLIGLGYFGRLFLQWVNRCLNTLLDRYFGGSVRTEELRTSSFSTAGDRRLFLIVWFHSLTFFHLRRQVCTFRATNAIQFIKSEKRRGWVKAQMFQKMASLVWPTSSSELQCCLYGWTWFLMCSNNFNTITFSLAFAETLEKP